MLLFLWQWQLLFWTESLKRSLYMSPSFPLSLSLSYCENTLHCTSFILMHYIVLIHTIYMLKLEVCCPIQFYILAHKIWIFIWFLTKLHLLIDFFPIKFWCSCVWGTKMLVAVVSIIIQVFTRVNKKMKAKRKLKPGWIHFLSANCW